MPDPNQPDQHHEPTWPYLLVPYFDGDLGARPLPVPFFLCPSVLVDGGPYSGLPIAAGLTVSLSARAINYGHACAAEVDFFWADPATAFSDKTVHLIGAKALFLPWKVAVTTTALSWKVGEEVPAHVCLLAQVSGLGDEPALPRSYNAAADRHYAQQNLQVVKLAAGSEGSASFYAANPGSEPASYVLSARPGQELAAQLAPLYGGSPLWPVADGVRLLAEGGEPGDAGTELLLELGPGERRPITVGISAPDELPGNFLAVTVEQRPLAEANEQPPPIGAVAIVALAED